MWWVLQVLLALAFLAHGLMFLMPSPGIAAQMNANLPRWFSLFLGVAEVLAFVGLLLPGLTRILPGLIVGAAATAHHLMRGETIVPMQHRLRWTRGWPRV